MEKIKTATGKEFSCESFSVIDEPPRLYIRVSNAPLATIATVFSDQTETVQLYYGNLYVAQYTKLLAIIPENGMVRVNLTKE